MLLHFGKYKKRQLKIKNNYCFNVGYRVSAERFWGEIIKIIIITNLSSWTLKKSFIKSFGV